MPGVWWGTCTCQQSSGSPTQRRWHSDFKYRKNEASKQQKEILYTVSLFAPGRNSCSPLKPNDSADRPTALVQTNTTQHLWKGLPWNLEKTFRYDIKTAFRKLEHQIIPTKWLVSLSDFWTIRSIMSMLVGLCLCKCSRNASLLVDMSWTGFKTTLMPHRSSISCSHKPLLISYANLDVEPHDEKLQSTWQPVKHIPPPRHNSVKPNQYKMNDDLSLNGVYSGMRPIIHPDFMEMRGKHNLLVYVGLWTAHLKPSSGQKYSPWHLNPTKYL